MDVRMSLDSLTSKNLSVRRWSRENPLCSDSHFVCISVFGHYCENDSLLIELEFTEALSLQSSLNKIIKEIEKAKNKESKRKIKNEQ